MTPSISSSQSAHLMAGCPLLIAAAPFLAAARQCAPLRPRPPGVAVLMARCARGAQRERDVLRRRGCAGPRQELGREAGAAGESARHSSPPASCLPVSPKALGVLERRVRALLVP